MNDISIDRDTAFFITGVLEGLIVSREAGGQDVRTFQATTDHIWRRAEEQYGMNGIAIDRDIAFYIIGVLEGLIMTREPGGQDVRTFQATVDHIRKRAEEQYGKDILSEAGLDENPSQ